MKKNIIQKNNFKKILASLLVLFLFASCARTAKKEQRIDVYSNTVSVDEEDGVSKKILVDTRNDNDHGKSQNAGVLSDEKRVKIAVFLGPSLSRSYSYVGFLKNLLREGIEIKTICGVEQGALIANLYASGMTLEKIDWLLYQFYRKTGSLSIGSEKWVMMMREEIDRYRSKNRLEKRNVELCAHLYNRTLEKDDLVFGEEVQQQMNSLFVPDSSINTYTFPKMKNKINLGPLRQRDVDFIVGVFSYGSEFDFRNVRDKDFYFSTYGKIQYYYKTLENQFDISINLFPDKKNVYLDEMPVKESTFINIESQNFIRKMKDLKIKKKLLEGADNE